MAWYMGGATLHSMVHGWGYPPCQWSEQATYIVKCAYGKSMYFTSVKTQITMEVIPEHRWSVTLKTFSSLCPDMHSLHTLVPLQKNYTL